MPWASDNIFGDSGTNLYTGPCIWILIMCSWLIGHSVIYHSAEGFFFPLHSGLVGCVPGHFYVSDLQMHARQGYLIVFIVLRNSQSCLLLFLF